MGSFRQGRRIAPVTPFSVATGTVRMHQGRRFLAWT